MPASSKLDHKIKSLAKIEGEFRTQIKQAQADIRRDPDHKKRYEGQIKKYRKKIDKLLGKVRRLRELRARRA